MEREKWKTKKEERKLKSKFRSINPSNRKRKRTINLLALFGRLNDETPAPTQRKTQLFKHLSRPRSLCCSLDLPKILHSIGAVCPKKWCEQQQQTNKKQNKRNKKQKQKQNKKHKKNKKKKRGGKKR
jgi:hypothetical protein